MSQYISTLITLGDELDFLWSRGFVCRTLHLEPNGGDTGVALLTDFPGQLSGRDFYEGK